MRLLHTRTGEFKWVEDPRQVHYAILSHVWARPSDPDYPEQTHQDLLDMQKEECRPGTLPSKFCDKLRHFCETALKDGFEFGWADTCCINKTSSSELSEAINSMYSWYAYSGACYAFLRDAKPRSVGPLWQLDFQRSQWFRRGWTLQELIAPRIVIFVFKSLNGKWEVLGSKHTLATDISLTSGIDIAILTLEKSLEDIPIARRMAWMQNREMTRLEDEAYCLMGIFSVNMQANYGEGRYAFIRLQEKILLQSPDQTIFAWGRFLDLDNPKLLKFHPPRKSKPSITPVSTSQDLSNNLITPPSFLKQYLLAPSPKDFDPNCSANMISLSRDVFQTRLGISKAPIEDLCQVFDITPYGIRSHFPLLTVSSPDSHPNAATRCAILACHQESVQPT